MKSIKKIIGATVLGAAALSSGCSQPNYNSISDNIFAGGEITVFDIGVRQYDIKMEKKTIPVHPDDTGFLHGTTDVNASGKYMDVPLSFKAKGLFGIEQVALTGGIELRLNTGHPNEANSKTYFYDYRQQSSDTRPASEGSFCFDEINPGWGTAVPTVGIKLFPCEKLQFDFEYGRPWTSMTRTWGHHRYNHEDAVGHENSSAFGQMFSAEVNYFFEKNIGVGLGYAREETKFDDIGEVKSNIFYFSWIFRF